MDEELASPSKTTQQPPISSNLTFSPKETLKNDDTASSEDGSLVDEVGPGVLGSTTEFVHVSDDEHSKLEVGTQNLEESNEILEGNRTITECSEMSVSCNNYSGIQSVEFGPKIDECIKMKGDVCSEKQSVEVELGKDCENMDYCKNMNLELEGLLPRLVKNHHALSYSLQVEVIDGTALLDLRNFDAKKPKKPVKDDAIGVSEPLNGERTKFVYSKQEMEALQFVNVKRQNKFWRKIYFGFPQNIRKEYDELGCNRHQKHGDRQPATRTKNHHGQGILGESTSENVNGDTETISPLDFACDGDNSGKDGDEMAGEWSGQEESDDEHESIQRPAFWVEGEPDFESGPPEDGLEYLRRVRWEATHIPKVKVAKIDNSKLNKEQSVYMPEIPDIETCPPHLVPLQQWENEFIADFSKLRLALSHMADTRDTDSESIVFSHKDISKRSSEGLALHDLPRGDPMLSEVLAMDPVTRVTMLKKRIKLFDSLSEFSKDDCTWLFALSAVVDTPLDADTCASLRCLLRKCAKLRASKSELDDEVVMLNILITISGKFFGQSDI